MGFFDSLENYFSDPDVSTGYIGMDNIGGTAWDNVDYTFPNDTDFGLAGDFWDTQSTWDNAYDAVFATTPEFDILSVVEEDPEPSWGDKALNFLGSKGGMSLVGGLLAGGLKAYGDAEKADALEQEKERERQFQAEQELLRREHEEKMLALRYELENDSYRPSPGTAVQTKSNLNSSPVRWEK